eukprot:6708224-Alexandrium_andersonii.AAC.1
MISGASGSVNSCKARADGRAALGRELPEPAPVAHSYRRHGSRSQTYATAHTQKRQRRFSTTPWQ